MQKNCPSATKTSHLPMTWNILLSGIYKVWILVSYKQQSSFCRIHKEISTFVHIDLDHCPQNVGFIPSLWMMCPVWWHWTWQLFSNLFSVEYTMLSFPVSLLTKGKTSSLEWTSCGAHLWSCTMHDVRISNKETFSSCFEEISMFPYGDCKLVEEK